MGRVGAGTAVLLAIIASAAAAAPLPPLPPATSRSRSPAHAAATSSLPSAAAPLAPPAAAAAAATATATPLPYMIDQAGHGVSTQDEYGFSVGRLRGYGVQQVAAYSIDCATTLDAIPGGPWYPPQGLALVNATRAQARSMVAVAHDAGLAAYLSSDIFQFPTALLHAYAANFTDPAASCIGYTRFPGGCIELTPFTRYAYGVLFDELLEAVPGIDGLVLRYGENSPCDYHQGNAPYDATNTSTTIASLTTLLLFLREELAVKRNVTVVFRTWDTSANAFHANASFYAAVVAGVPPHPKLVFSIKHTALDFWRRVRPNPTLGVGAHAQVAEVEVGGMYGGCGTWPLYVVDGALHTFEEDAGQPWAGQGIAWLRAAHADTFAGVLTNHQCTSTPQARDPWVWWRLEEAVIAGWARTPDADEAALFDAAVAAQLGIADAGVRAAFRNWTLTAMSANLRIQTCAAFDVTLGEVDRPTANYFLWDGLGGLPTLANTTCHAFNPAHCMVIPWLVQNGAVPAALAEKAEAVALYAGLNASAHAALPAAMPNATLARAVLVSFEAGAALAAIVEAGWTVMVWGWAGDAAGRYNVSGIRGGVARYDAAWAAYRGLADKYGALAPGLMNGTYWQHPTSGVPGMDASVDKYRGV